MTAMPHWGVHVHPQFGNMGAVTNGVGPPTLQRPRSHAGLASAGPEQYPEIGRYFHILQLWGLFETLDT